MIAMAKYKVCFSGFAYIEADSKEEAVDIYNEDDFDYCEQEITSCEEVDEFLVELDFPMGS